MLRKSTKTISEHSIAMIIIQNKKKIKKIIFYLTGICLNVYLRIIKNEVLWQSDKNSTGTRSLGFSGFGYFKLNLRSESKDKDWKVKPQKADVTYVTWIPRKKW